MQSFYTSGPKKTIVGLNFNVFLSTADVEYIVGLQMLNQCYHNPVSASGRSA
jgi:hypothetical protein